MMGKVLPSEDCQFHSVINSGQDLFSYQFWTRFIQLSILDKIYPFFWDNCQKAFSSIQTFCSWLDLSNILGVDLIWNRGKIQWICFASIYSRSGEIKLLIAFARKWPVPSRARFNQFCPGLDLIWNQGNPTARRSDTYCWRNWQFQNPSWNWKTLTLFKRFSWVSHKLFKIYISKSCNW